MSILVRFTEFQRYDINRDCEVTQFCASISTGTYHTEIPVAEGAPLRVKREQFKDKVAELIQKGVGPQQVTL